MRASIEELAQSLPSECPDDDSRARVVLGRLADEMRLVTPMPAVPRDPSTCPNCGDPCSSVTSPYCGDCCREQAAYVRQFRQALANGSALDPERQIAKGEVLWRLLGGGLPRRVARLPEREKAKVFAKVGGRCGTCGAPATRIDNTGTG